MDNFKKKLDRLTEVPGGFVSSVESVQGQLSKEVVSLLNKLKVVDGNIVLSASNMAIIGRIDKAIEDHLFEGQYLDVLKEFVGEIETQAGLTNSYFKSEFGENIGDESIYKATVKQAQKNALDLLDADAVSANFTTPLTQQLNVSVTTGASFGDTVEAVTNYINGNAELDGALVRYAKTTSYDAFAISDRQYTKILSTAVEVEFYQYVGGIMQDSREFCVERHGKFYHQKEIESWASEEWQGKRKGTNETTIFSFCGGYRCEHSIKPVSVAAVPKDVVERAIEKGWYKQAA